MRKGQNEKRGQTDGASSVCGTGFIHQRTGFTQQRTGFILQLPDFIFQQTGVIGQSNGFISTQMKPVCIFMKTVRLWVMSVRRRMSWFAGEWSQSFSGWSSLNWSLSCFLFFLFLTTASYRFWLLGPLFFCQVQLFPANYSSKSKDRLPSEEKTSFN